MSETPAVLGPERIEALFTARDGGYRFSRWGRDIAPVVFGIDDETLSHLKAAMATVLGLAGQSFAETDPEFGANLMIFFCRDWEELEAIPNLDKLIPDLGILVASLARSGANQYRTFNFDADGAIRICIALLRHDEHMADTSVQALGVAQMTQSILLWGDDAFADDSPVALVPPKGVCVVKPEYAALIRAAYDPVLPNAASDASHALRLAARAATGPMVERGTASDDASA